MRNTIDFVSWNCACRWYQSCLLEQRRLRYVAVFWAALQTSCCLSLFI